MPKKQADLRDVNLRHVVKACASDADIVAYFNETHGLSLMCPIKALVEPVFPLGMSEEEMLHAAWFVAWVQHNQWQRLKSATTNLKRLKRLYGRENARDTRPRKVH